MSEEEIENHLNELISSAEKNERRFKFSTGSEGAKKFTLELMIQMKEFAYNKKLSPEDIKECEDIINSEEWPSGMYEISEFGINYLG